MLSAVVEILSELIKNTLISPDSVDADWEVAQLTRIFQRQPFFCHVGVNLSPGAHIISLLL